MILDIKVLLGRWPFMPLKYEGVLTLTDRDGIDKAVVASLNGVSLLNSNRQTKH